jgi:hypothetical protein
MRALAKKDPLTFRIFAASAAVKISAVGSAAGAAGVRFFSDDFAGTAKIGVVDNGRDGMLTSYTQNSLGGGGQRDRLHMPRNGSESPEKSLRIFSGLAYP